MFYNMRYLSDIYKQSRRYIYGMRIQEECFGFGLKGNKFIYVENKNEIFN